MFQDHLHSRKIAHDEDREAEVLESLVPMGAFCDRSIAVSPRGASTENPFIVRLIGLGNVREAVFLGEGVPSIRVFDRFVTSEVAENLRYPIENLGLEAMVNLSVVGWVSPRCKMSNG